MARDDNPGQSAPGRLRRKRGISVIDLAGNIGVSRQTIYAMEAGTYIPNTTVALRLARALQTTVEELFPLQEDLPEPNLRSETTQLLGDADPPQTGQPVQLCRVDRKLVAVSPSPAPWYFPATDAVVEEKPGRRGMTKVQVFHAGTDFTNRILIAGCDPGISVLDRHVRAAGVELVLAHRNSSQALALLKEGSVHIAGTHLRDEASGESNLPEICRLFPRNSVAVFSFAVWEEGILTARGNPAKIRGVEDFTRKDVSIANRERGSGSRKLVDSRLKQAGIAAGQVRGYDRLATGHLAAAWQVASGAADCCVATGAAARIFGLHFLPLVTERYDLVLNRRHLELPRMQSILDTLSRAGFRRELECLGGYDTRVTGQRVL